MSVMIDHVAAEPRARSTASKEGQTMSLKRYLISQFKRPRGPLGRLAGWTMARRASNRRRNEWTIELLDLEPDTRVLEIGCGPGYALDLVGRRVTRGRIVGLDHSRTMCDAARKRNRSAVAAGRMTLFVGSAERLEELAEPALAGPFDRIFAVNVAMFWADPAAVFGRFAKRLAPGGRVCITTQPRTGEKTDAAALAFADRLAQAMGAGGLASVRVERLTELSTMAVCVVGHRQETGHRPASKK